MFTTENLILRAYREEDLDRVLDLWNEYPVQVATALDHVVPRTPKIKETFRGWLDNARLHFVIETRSENDFVGYLTLRNEYPKNRDGDIAITLTQKHWGKGFGTEVLRFTVDYAFKALNLHRVSLGVFSVNERATNLYKKIGFVEEGRLRKATWIDGEWRDVILMGILEEDWTARAQ